MKNLSTKTLIGFLSIASLILLGIVCYGVYTINNKSVSTAETLAKVEEGSANSILVQSINSSTDNSNNELEELDGLALSQDKLVGFIETLEGLAEEMNLVIKITSVNIEEGDGGSTPDKIHFKIETNGNWSGSMQFLHAIEYLPYRTMINNTSISSKNSQGFSVVGTSSPSQGKTWKLNTDLALYSFK